MPRVIDRKENGLTQGQETFFILGFTWPFLGHSTFPFASEAERESLWKKYKVYLITKCHEPRIHGNFCAPKRNQLRPLEWWIKDAPEARHILNGVKILNAEKHFYDREPILETDYEYLKRLNLLTSTDIEYIKSADFLEEEGRDIEYQTYIER